MNPNAMHVDDDADRDSWATPLWLAEAIGPVWLDPCSNERSHIMATRTFRLERGQDGIRLARYVRRDSPGIVFVNPPYSRGNAIRFVAAYARHRFCFLMRFDPSTEWFAMLHARTAAIAVPRTRVNFEPPPDVEPSDSNPFPHALFYSRLEDVTPAIHAECWVSTPVRNPHATELA